MNYGLTSLPIEIISFLQSTEHYEDLTKKLKSSSKDENICVNTVSSYTRRLRTHWKTFCTTTTEASEWFNLSKSLLQKRINETQYADLKSGGDIS